MQFAYGILGSVALIILVFSSLRWMRSKSNRRLAAAALDYTSVPPIEGRYTLHVSGEEFDDRQSIIIGQLEVGESLRLRREPDNVYDEDAVSIQTATGDLIGYVPGKNSAWVARLLDEGKHLRASVAHLFVEDGIVNVQIHIDGVPRRRTKRA